MTTIEILAVLGCGGLFVLLGLLTRDRPSSLLLRAAPGPEDCETDAERCGGCASASTCKTSERHDA
jgi:hypothetical protein